ncbi:hypothetical protein LO771_24400 [Streptacidiphilus sp. ASG 303]|uniref:hypothetical protein n=1 Tax=Streptacidiphilus sp. ASG 303 TaxID=2896847 RepID=UPI001E4A8739|nr:hypothetical protein [Streptacidiphilus sp. ASG 303]MCD0485439.1 hypothetical protein [Streptacidiphilus sp. ASG 303]
MSDALQVAGWTWSGTPLGQSRRPAWQGWLKQSAEFLVRGVKGSLTGAGPSA